LLGTPVPCGNCSRTPRPVSGPTRLPRERHLMRLPCDRIRQTVECKQRTLTRPRAWHTSMATETRHSPVLMPGSQAPAGRDANWAGPRQNGTATARGAGGTERRRNRTLTERSADGTGSASGFQDFGLTAEASRGKGNHFSRE